VRLSSRRLAVAATALATLAAALPALGALQASAAATGDIRLTGPGRGAAGACLSYSVQPVDAFGGPATDTGTVVIRLSESPNAAAQDVDFCRPGAVSAPAVSPHHATATGARRFYVAGGSVTDTPTTAKTKTSVADSGTGVDNPDTASSNPSGADTALYVYDGRSGGSTAVTFGVAGLVSGGARIDVFRSADGDETQSSGDLTRSLSVQLSEGGLPESPQAADAVTSLVASPEQSYSPQGSTAHAFAVQLSNSSGDGIAGITPLVRSTSGVNGTCSRSSNTGVSTCTFPTSKAGAEQLTFWVNQTRAHTPEPTLGLDPGEVRDTATATTTSPVSAARFVDLTPATATVVQGDSQQYTARVTDANGVPVAGVGLAFTETGPGGIANGAVGSGGTSSTNATSDASGAASVTMVTTTAEQGTGALTVAVRNPAATACQSPGGRCSDSSTLLVQGNGSPSPTPSASPTRVPACTTAITTLPVDTISATGFASVVVSAAKASNVDLYAYSRPSTVYGLVRTGTVTQDGTVTFSIRPATNTRLYAQQRGCTAGDSVVLAVRTTLSIAVLRNGARDYTFSGDSVPARPGGLIVNVYRVNSDGSEVLSAQARADATDGQWVFRKQFTGGGRFGFVARTGQDMSNAPGRSNLRSLLVY
jgi:hypothetical protein